MLGAQSRMFLTTRSYLNRTAPAELTQVLCTWHAGHGHFHAFNMQLDAPVIHPITARHLEPRGF